MATDTMTYYRHWQVPIFLILLLTLWGVVGIRLVVFKRRFPGWGSFRGVSMLLVLLSGILCSTYVFMHVAILMLNMRVEGFKNGVIVGTNQTRQHHPESGFTDEQADITIWTLGRLDAIGATQRLLLVIALYLVKAAFLAIFLETKGHLSPRMSVVTVGTGIILVVSFVVVLWMMIRDWVTSMMNGWLDTTREDVRLGMTSEYSVNFEPPVEITHATLNIFTDALLVLIAYKTVRAFPVPISSAILPCSMAVTTVAIAIARLPMIVYDSKQQHYDRSVFVIPFQLLWELETFLATLLACLPGLKVFMEDAVERAVENRGRPRENGLVFGQKREDVLKDLENGQPAIDLRAAMEGKLLMPEELEKRAAEAEVYYTMDSEKGKRNCSGGGSSGSGF